MVLSDAGPRSLTQQYTTWRIAGAVLYSATNALTPTKKPHYYTQRQLNYALTLVATFAFVVVGWTLPALAEDKQGKLMCPIGYAPDANGNSTAFPRCSLDGSADGSWDAWHLLTLIHIYGLPFTAAMNMGAIQVRHCFCGASAPGATPRIARARPPPKGESGHAWSYL